MFRWFIVISSFSVAAICTLMGLDAHGVRFDELEYGVPGEMLAQKGDLYDYVDALHGIIEFVSNNKIDLDMNLEFGLFLTNVNLKLGLKKRSKKLPKKLSLFLKSLLEENTKLIYFFQYMVYLNKDPKEKSNKLISSLFTNDTKWISRVRSFKRRPLMSRQPQLRGQYGSKAEKGSSIYAYIKKIKNMDDMMPTPKLSDMCFRSLASNIDHQLRPTATCVLYEPCYYALKKGTNYGYGLSHRLLLIVNARLARGCHIFTSDTDRMLTEKFCQMAYEEIQFVTTQGYEIIDLILEFITLCALDGHGEFLRQDWLTKSLSFQTTHGCFGVTVADDSQTAPFSKHEHSWKMAKKDHRLLGGVCDGHVTSVAAAALSAAIRYLLETYY